MKQIHRFKVDKLVRDKTPEIMKKSGIAVDVYVMEQNEYEQRLNDKLIEEAHEVIDANTTNERCEELADLLEVMMAIAQLSNIKFSDIVKAAEQKKSEKGSFEKRIYSAYVELESKHPNFDYYNLRPEHYPEIK